MRILLVEDDADLCMTLEFQLKKDGYVVDICQNGIDAISFAKEMADDIILLDRMLPGLDGLSVLTKIREMGIDTPVIMVTALGELHDRVSGLNGGADDYLIKPFEYEELTARIRSIARRQGKMINTNLLKYGDTTLAPTELTLTGPKGSCKLSKRESQLLEVLYHNSTQTLTRELLLTKVWGPYADVESGNLDNYIHFLRRRYNSVGSNTQIKTIRGVGYKLFY